MWDIFRKNERGDTNPHRNNQGDGQQDFTKKLIKRQAIRNLQENIQARCDKLLPLAHLSEYGIGCTQRYFEGMINGLKSEITATKQTRSNALTRLKEFNKGLAEIEKRMSARNIAEKLNKEISKRSEQITEELRDSKYFGPLQEKQIQELLIKIGYKHKTANSQIGNHHLEADEGKLMQTVGSLEECHKDLKELETYLNRYKQANQEFDRHYNRLLEWREQYRDDPSKCKDIMGCEPQELILSLMEARLASAKIFSRGDKLIEHEDWTQEVLSEVLSDNFELKIHRQLQDMGKKLDSFENWPTKVAEGHLNKYLQSTADRLNGQFQQDYQELLLTTGQDQLQLLSSGERLPIPQPLPSEESPLHEHLKYLRRDLTDSLRIHDQTRHEAYTKICSAANPRDYEQGLHLFEECNHKIGVLKNFHDKCLKIEGNSLFEETHGLDSLMRALGGFSEQEDLPEDLQEESDAAEGPSVDIIKRFQQVEARKPEKLGSTDPNVTGIESKGEVYKIAHKAKSRDKRT